jgi:hypothetical protein
MTADHHGSLDQTKLSYPLNQRWRNGDSHPPIIEPLASEWQAWSVHNTVEQCNYITVNRL